MIRLLVRYLTNVSKITVHQWNCFWFATRPTFDIGITRVAIGFLAAIYAAGWCFDLYGWTQPDGKLNDSVTRFLIGDQIEGTGSIGRVSLLYQLESKWMVQSYLIVTSLFSIALALGIGGRAIAVVTWILTLGIVHRVPMLQGSGDLLFVGIMGYLAIDPGKTKRLWSIGIEDRMQRWSTNLATRLMQCHVILWLLVSLIGHLAEPMWWSGNAAWWLASAELSPWFSAHYLSDKPYLINFLSHGFLFVHLMTIGLLFRQNYRPLAIAAALLMAIGVWLLAGDWLYGLAIILCTSPFWGTAVRELRCEFSEVSNLEIETEDRQPVKKNPVIRRPARRLGT